jgi:hypothetical protein
MALPAEIGRRELLLERLAAAAAPLQERSAERFAADQAVYEEELAERAAREAETGRKPGGKPPRAPEPGPLPTDQYNFTDPESRIMKDSHA